VRLLQPILLLHLCESITVAHIPLDADRSDATASLEAYPNLRTAAEMLGVAPSTISRRADLHAEARGERDRVVPPTEVLRLGSIFRKRSINDVAQALLDHAEPFGDEAFGQVEREIEAYFDEHTVARSVEELRRLARQLLPSELAEQVESSLDQPAGDMPTLVEGYVPLAED